MSNEFVGHDETADEAARQERYAKWEEYMNCVDRGEASLEQAMSTYAQDMAAIGATVLKSDQ